MRVIFWVTSVPGKTGTRTWNRPFARSTQGAPHGPDRYCRPACPATEASVPAERWSRARSLDSAQWREVVALPVPWQGVEQMLSMGTYPDTSLVLARTRRDDARQQLAKGVDPGAERRKARDPVDRSFRGVAQHWLAGLEKLVRAGKRSEKTLKKAKWALETYVYPELGRREINTISPRNFSRF